MHDSFEWWAEIWIPVFLGLGTVVVSIAAFWSAHRATVIARASELQRERDLRDREAESKRDRLREMAILDARVLRKWVSEAINPRGMSLIMTLALGGQPPERIPFDEARQAAEVQLEQSLVPGAEELFDVTSWDIFHRGNGLPVVGETDSDALAERRKIVEARDQRMLARIKNWVWDPERYAPEFRAELESVRRDPDSYFASVTPTDA